MTGERIVVVDDTPQNIRLLEAVLLPRGYQILAATSGQAALDLIASESPDLVLLDIVMPRMDGYEVCRRLRADPATRLLPIVMVTASGDQEKVKAIEAGADDFIPKPVNQPELLARVRSLLRIKSYHDTIQRQTAELAAWNQTLTERVQRQVEELERLSRFRRFLSPQLAEVILASGGEKLLESHLRQIAVVFCDLRGFTPFAEHTSPESIVAILHEYHAALGDLVNRFDGTVGHFAGDGLMVFFNDPLPCPDPAARAVRMALAMRNKMVEVTAGWVQRGHRLGFGIGIAFGLATVGQIGFEGRVTYSPIGRTVNLAARLCDEAPDGAVYVDHATHGAVNSLFETTQLADLTLKGFARPEQVFSVSHVR